MGRSINWKELVVNTLFLRDQGICHLCMRKINQSELFEVDHIVEKSNGGLDVIENLRLVHLGCHKTRHQNKMLSISPDVIKRAEIIRRSTISIPMGVTFQDAQNNMVIEAMQKCKNNKSQAAKMLGLTRAKFRVMLKNTIS
jgi:hypothetical protein